MKSTILQYLIARSQEASTWRGIALIAAAFGFSATFKRV